jgi:hypothetical protein
MLLVAVPASLVLARLFAAVFELPFQRHRGWPTRGRPESRAASRRDATNRNRAAVAVPARVRAGDPLFAAAGHASDLHSPAGNLEAP